MSIALVDNDVLYKTAMYGLALSLLGTEPFGAKQFHMLGVTRFMISKKLTKRPPARGAELALQEFDALLAKLSVLEPTNDEVVLAADLEYFAGQRGYALDGGESLLCAILLTRGSDYLFTGDKRAIMAIGMLIPQQSCKPLAGRVVCLEQLFKELLSRVDPAVVREAVCAEPKVDTALTNCFACHSPAPAVDGIFEGLNSYVGSIRTAALGVLYDI